MNAALLDIVGVRMFRVPEFGGALILLKRKQVLVDDALDEDQIALVVDQVLSAAAAALSAA